MALLVDEKMAHASSRLSSIRLSMFMLRAMENWRELKSLRNPVPPEHLPPCNISSIAAATVLNRETARRKVNELVEAGILDRWSSGTISFRPGVLERDGTSRLMRRQLEAVVRVMNDLIREGPVRIA